MTTVRISAGGGEFVRSGMKECVGGKFGFGYNFEVLLGGA